MATEATLNRSTLARRAPPRPDLVLVGLIAALLGIGLVMVASAPLPTADGSVSLSGFYHQAVCALLGLVVAVVLYGTPLEVIERLRYPLLAAAFILLAAVLIPGIGHAINGSARWLSLGPLTVQASEPARVMVLIYVAGYGVSHREGLTQSFWGLAKPVAVVALAGLLLLAEPDFGGTIVLLVTALGVLFFAGARKRDTVVLAILFGGAAIALAFAEPYRLERLSAFLNPWATARTTGFQLVQALIAAGHGGLFGVGLGESVEKLLYLPEAQSDFLFSVLAEELGLAGVTIVIGLYLAFVLRAFAIARRAASAGHGFAANLAFAVGLFLGVQAFVNMGVNLGVLPTKGLTLPLMSAGGSSLVVILASCGLLMRAAREAEATASQGAASRRKARRTRR
ncbi:MAG: putative lipid II flippase FtsW [Gammaproteobacteria bacterium]|nr:putative lipid II flippase FtsW [Gammaproteobacteria bacterium]